MISLILRGRKKKNITIIILLIFIIIMGVFIYLVYNENIELNKKGDVEQTKEEVEEEANYYSYSEIKGLYNYEEKYKK